MAFVPSNVSVPIPTNLAPLPALLPYTESLGLERWLARPKRGIATLVLVLVWLVLAWRASGRPEHVDQLNEPFLARLLGLERLPCARTLRRSLASYRQRRRVERAIEELLNGHDLDHPVSYRLHPNQVAIGFRLLARNLAIGMQIRIAGARPAVIGEPRAFRVTQVEGLGHYTLTPEAIVLQPLEPQPAKIWRLPWTHGTVRRAA